MSPLAVTFVCIAAIIVALFVAYYFQVLKKKGNKRH